jgi:hypothetical protein
VEILAWLYLLDQIVTPVTQRCLLQDNLECLDNLVCLLRDNLESLDNLECLDNLVCREILAWPYLLARLVTPVTQRCLQDNLVCLDNLLLEEPLIVHSLPVLQGQHAKLQQRDSSLTFELVA